MLLYVQAMSSIHARDGQTPLRSLPVVSCDLIFRLAGTNDDAVTSFSAISALAPAFGAGDRTRVVRAHVGPPHLGRSDEWKAQGHALNKRKDTRCNRSHGPGIWQVWSSRIRPTEGQQVSVHLISVRANISKIKCWKCFEVLSAFTPATRIGAHKGVGALTKSAKARTLYI